MGGPQAGRYVHPAPCETKTANSRPSNDPPLTRQHAARRLRDVEGVLLERHRPALQGSVLEWVPGGSRLTTELVEHAGSYTGIGPSVALIGICRQVYPRGTFIHGDLDTLDQLAAGGFSAVVAGRCGIDSLDEPQRRLLLERLARVLSHTGVLIFSSHNRPEPGVEPAAEARSSRRGGGLLRRMRSSRAPMDDRELGDELLSGIDGDLATPQYRIGRDEQERQLSELGFRLLECLDLEARPVPPGDPAAESPELHYVAVTASIAM